MAAATEVQGKGPIWGQRFLPTADFRLHPAPPQALRNMAGEGAKAQIIGDEIEEALQPAVIGHHGIEGHADQRLGQQGFQQATRTASSTSAKGKPNVRPKTVRRGAMATLMARHPRGCPVPLGGSSGR